MHTSVKNATIFQNVSAHAIDVRALSVLMRIIFFFVLYMSLCTYIHILYIAFVQTFYWAYLLLFMVIFIVC